MRGATPSRSYRGGGHYISIHAPRAGGDYRRACGTGGERISIHAPRAGGDYHHFLISFYSTKHFNPRPPCGGRQGLRCRKPSPEYFNPRPPCGGRLDKLYEKLTAKQFQSTPPVRGATTGRAARRGGYNRISIHAPRAGGDKAWRRYRCIYQNFNPRPPCGGRPANGIYVI